MQFYNKLESLHIALLYTSIQFIERQNNPTYYVQQRKLKILLFCPYCVPLMLSTCATTFFTLSVCEYSLTSELSIRKIVIMLIDHRVADWFSCYRIIKHITYYRTLHYHVSGAYFKHKERIMWDYYVYRRYLKTFFSFCSKYRDVLQNGVLFFQFSIFFA